jgi:Ca2+-binding RTX toxin-like protein
VAVITGDDKGNKLEGTSDPDLIQGNGGNDELSGLGSDDQLDPGPGRDGVDGGPGSDTLLLHEATLVSLADGDTESLEPSGRGRPERDELTSVENVQGSDRDDIIIGDGQDNDLRGGRGDDQVDGEEGSDTLLGEEGRDQLLGDEGNDVERGGPGGDILLGDAGDDDIDGEAGQDVLDGGIDNDLMQGGDGADLLVGAEGDDWLSGGRGIDALFAGPGDDTLEAGKGADIFRGEAGDDHLILGQGRDHADFFFAEQFPGFESIDSDTVEGFVRARHQLDINLEGFLTEGRVAAIDVRDFLDSNDDGRIDGTDSEVHQIGGDLVLDLDAVMTRALGQGAFGTQEVTLQGVANFSAERIAAADNPPFFDPLVTEDGVVEPLFGFAADDDQIA